MALQLAQAGCHLYLTDLTESTLAEMAAELEPLGVEVRYLAVDLADADETARLAQQVLADFGTLDILINNAGVCFYGSTLRMTEPQWDWLMAVNLMAPVRLIHALLPVLVERPEAHILNVSSIYGHVVMGRSSGYHLTKFALVGLSEALRAEFNRDGLGVTALCPGFVRTEFFNRMTCGSRTRGAPVPPRWVCVTPDQVARKALWAIRRNKRMVLVGWLAHGLYLVRRMFPGLIDTVYSFCRSRKHKATPQPVVESTTSRAA